MTPDAEAVLKALRDGPSPRDAHELAIASGVGGQPFERAVEELDAMGLTAPTPPKTGAPGPYSFDAVRLLINSDDVAGLLD